MAAPTTTDNWDEYLTKISANKFAAVDSWIIGLYNDGTNLLGPTSDMAAITTEPSGGNYARKTVTPSTATTIVEQTGDYKTDVADQTWSGLTFTTATTVDAWFMAISVLLDGDTAATEHLMAAGTLSGGAVDLSKYTDFTVQDIGIVQTQK